MQPTPIQRLHAAVPPALLIGVVTAVIGELALSVYQVRLAALSDLEAVTVGWARYSLAANAAWVASTVPIAVGLREVARRGVVGNRAVVTAAAILTAVVAVCAIGSIYIESVVDLERSTHESIWRWGARFTLAAWLGAAACLVFALRRGSLGVVVALAAALLVTTLLAHPPWMMRSWFYFDGWTTAKVWANGALAFGYGAAHASALVLAVFELCRREPPLLGETTRVAEGLTRIGTALVARVVIAMGFVFAMLLAIGARSPSLAKLALVAVPVVALLATIAMISGMFQAAGNAGAAAPPRYRFTLAAVLTLGSLVLISIQAVAAYWLVTHGGGSSDPSFAHERQSMQAVVSAFPYLGPAITLAGLLCLISAVASLRAQRGPILGSAEPSTAAAMVVTFTIAAVAVQRWAATAGGNTGTYLVMLIAVTVATIAAQLAVARLCHKAGDGLVAELPTDLPTARIHVPL